MRVMSSAIVMTISNRFRTHATWMLTLIAAVSSLPGADDPNAPASAAAKKSGVSEYVEVTTTRIPEPVDLVPASVTIVTRADLIARGARNMRGALALAVGVDFAPGGDGGPSSSVPEIFGLREFDAFLLVVDGVPWGGAFNPSLATVDFLDVDRIEVVRGSAPVMYGATSFSGVINVIRRQPGHQEIEASASIGSYGAGSVAVSYGLPKWGSLASTVSAGVERLAFTDDRTQADRGHALWHGVIPQEHGRVRVGLDATWLGQDPASPHPRVGTSLTPAVSLDTNLNPTGSHLNERRIAASGGYDRNWTGVTWSSTGSLSHSDQSVARGFLADVIKPVSPAEGWRQGITIVDLYLDSHVEITKWSTVKAVFGLDHLHGDASSDGGTFDYDVPRDGVNVPDIEDFPSDTDDSIDDRREFSGLYLWSEWSPAARWRLEAGWRLNHTIESRHGRSEDLTTGTVDSDSDRKTVTRGSGAAGVTFTAWQSGPDAFRIFADGRSTYKPAAVDLGPEVEPDILEPETSTSAEIGIKARGFGGRVEGSFTEFRMDMENLVVSQAVNGVPTLTNAGNTRFQGAEAEIAWNIRNDLAARGTWALHDSRFTDYLTEFGGVPTQLAGNRVEMSPKVLGGVGVVYSPARGLVASGQVSVVGNRYLNKRNTALEPSYAAYSAGLGWRDERWEVRLDGTNLADRRPPVSESELGESQYYLLPARSVILSVRARV